MTFFQRVQAFLPFSYAIHMHVYESQDLISWECKMYIYNIQYRVYSIFGQRKNVRINQIKKKFLFPFSLYHLILPISDNFLFGRGIHEVFNCLSISWFPWQVPNMLKIDSEKCTLESNFYKDDMDLDRDVQRFLICRGNFPFEDIDRQYSMVQLNLYYLVSSVHILIHHLCANIC